jgi:hypothetical protein
MKGAMAELSVNTSKAPTIKRKAMIGAIHHFFLTFRNDHISLITSSRPIIYLLLLFRDMR